MYICVCAAVTDRAIRAQVGAGANCLDDLRIDLGVALKCGSCVQAAQQVIDDTRATLIHVNPHAWPHDAPSSEPGRGHRVPNARAAVWPIREIA